VLRVEEDVSSHQKYKAVQKGESCARREKWTYEKRSSPTPYPRPVRQFRVQYSVYSNTHTRHAHSTRARKAHTDDISPSLAGAVKRYLLSVLPPLLSFSVTLALVLALAPRSRSLARSLIHCPKAVGSQGGTSTVLRCRCTRRSYSCSDDRSSGGDCSLSSAALASASAPASVLSRARSASHLTCSRASSPPVHKSPQAAALSPSPPPLPPSRVNRAEGRSSPYTLGIALCSASAWDS